MDWSAYKTLQQFISLSDINKKKQSQTRSGTTIKSCLDKPPVTQFMTIKKTQKICVWHKHTPEGHLVVLLEFVECAVMMWSPSVYSFVGRLSTFEFLARINHTHTSHITNTHTHTHIHSLYRFGVHFNEYRSTWCWYVLCFARIN